VSALLDWLFPFRVTKRQWDKERWDAYTTALRFAVKTRSREDIRANPVYRDFYG
jgi:hypothetical protein